MVPLRTGLWVLCSLFLLFSVSQFAKMSDRASMMEEAKAMGLVGDQVLKFITDQQAVQREQRAHELELRKMAHEEADRIRKHELDLLAAQNQSSSRDGSSAVRVEKANLPHFKQGDNMTAFLIRFERIATLLSLPRESWAVRLGSLLSGKAAEMYVTFDEFVTADYDLLKEALLTGHNLTAETYRQEFRMAKIGSEETFAMFASGLRRKLEFWFNAAKVERTVEGLTEFLILDQLMAGVSMELRQFLKEKGKLSLDETIKAADNWSSAHGRQRSTVNFGGNNNKKFGNWNSTQHKESQKSSHQGESPKSQSGQSGQSQAKSSTQLYTNKATEKQSEVYKGPPKCFTCGVVGHTRSKCPKMERPDHKISNIYSLNNNYNSSYSERFITAGTVNGLEVAGIVRDTGCSCVVLASSVLPEIIADNGRSVVVADFLGRTSRYPLVRIMLRCKFYNGWVDAVLAPIKGCNVLVGNVAGVIDDFDSESCGAVTRLRAQVKDDRDHLLKLPGIPSSELTPEQFKLAQKSCSSLSRFWNDAKLGREVTNRNGSKSKYIVDNGLLYRECLFSKFKSEIGVKQLLVPVRCRNLVLQIAHEHPLAGHFSHNKTRSKLNNTFFWPGCSEDVRRYCRSCHTCQVMSHQGRVRPATLGVMPIIGVPFERISMDIVGPVTPMSEGGHRYILTVIDWATGFPEAIPLKTIDSIAVAEALLTVFARVGIPAEIFSDQGSNFTSKLMGDLHNLLGVKPIFSSPYMAQSNGRQERLHSTLKLSLRKLIQEKPKDWHKYIVATLFAIREMPSDRTGLSSFELLYGRQVRGPLAILSELWSNSTVSTEERSVFQYILDLKSKLYESAEQAIQSAKLAQSKYKTYFDLKARDRKFEVGDEVLLMLPDDKEKLLMSWQGPFKILKKVSRVHYLINNTKVGKIYHINLLKKYVRREPLALQGDNVSSVCPSVPHSVFFLSHGAFIDETSLVESDDNLSDVPKIVGELDLDLPTGSTQVSKPCEFSFGPELSMEQRDQMNTLVNKFDDVFSNKPGYTEIISHKIELTTTAPLRSQYYPVPVHLRDSFNSEVDDLLDNDIIQPSASNFSSPVVMVKKKDGSFRLAIDFRYLNSFSKFDAEPSFNIEDDLFRFRDSKYFSELDLCKAYYQVNLSEESRHLTAFATHRGLMEFKRMPFGLVTACQTYARLMRLVFNNFSNVAIYFDNIVVFSVTWEQHLEVLAGVFERLREFGLTVKPSKCHFGFAELDYLGFKISGSSFSPQTAKLDAIDRAPAPTSKKALRSFLGLVSFYRRFVPNLASATALLSDLLKKDVKEPLVLTEDHLEAFSSVKQSLVSCPVLQIPDLSKQFIVRTDASEVGVGGILMQYHSDVLLPVAYASRKLLSNEKNYSTVEKECLAIVFAVRAFSLYLLGAKFLLEVDHRPLVYLSKMKNLNQRLARWALILQPFNFSVVFLPGRENVGADFLSRL